MVRRLVYLLIPFFLFMGKSYSAHALCSCETPLLWEQYVMADFVALVELKKNYANSPGEFFYLADIEVTEVFKGEAQQTLRIYGNNGTPFHTSCDIFIPEGTRMIFYAQADSDDQYAIGFCSRYILVNSMNDTEVVRELNILEVLQREAEIPCPVPFTLSPIGLSQALEKLKGKRVKTNFGIFAFHLDADLKATDMEVMSSFNRVIDKKILKLLRNEVLWKYELTQQGAPLSSHGRYVLILYYHESRSKSKSFFSPAYAK